MAIDFSALSPFHGFLNADGASKATFTLNANNQAQATGRKWNITQGIRSRSPGEVADNNRIRNRLLTSLTQAFGLKFDAAGLAELEDTLGADVLRLKDFGLKGGEVHSGKPLTERRIVTIMTRVKEVQQERLAFLSKIFSLDKVDFSEDMRQKLADKLSDTKSDGAPGKYFDCSLDHSFTQAALDAPRGAYYIIGKEEEPGDENFDIAHHRNLVKDYFHGSEPMVRLFNSLAHQGGVGSMVTTRADMEDAKENPRTQHLLGNAFTASDTATMDWGFQRYRLTEQENGDFRIQVKHVKQGDRHQDFDEHGMPASFEVDPNRSRETYEMDIVMGPANANDENAKCLEYTDEQGQKQKFYFHLDVNRATHEIKCVATSEGRPM